MTNKSTVTSSTKTMESTSPIKISQKSPVPTNILSTNNEQGNKENGPSGSHDMRCKLHRLGKLYSGKQIFKKLHEISIIHVYTYMEILYIISIE